MSSIAKVIPFDFEKHPIRVTVIDGNPWFLATDICKAIGLTNTTMALQALDDDERSKLNLGRQGNANIINESGLFTLILRCREATTAGTPQHRFRKWVTAEVLPQIRKTGSYSIGQSIGEDGFNCLSSLIEGKTTKIPSKYRRSVHSRIWAQVHKAFGVRSGHDIPADQLSDVRNFIAAYAIEGEYLPSQGQSELGLYEKSLAEPFLGLDHLKLSGNQNIPDGRKLLKEMGKYMPAKAQPLLVELEATMVRQWAEVDESLHRILSAQHSINTIQRSMETVQSSVSAAQTYISRSRGHISELPDQI